ncbi:cytochrome P450 [Actinosynnema sp. NPDC047251]|uniref:Cytochrome P450 family protein n=1 Tax=Saccharothrix espanaensis (strain ATCC 51144 / DSM 44229 / JCM 9112 / NBRC 15066 / NRRL 15764) TaxID=1179773 RepID=K0KAT4_SACES|nr:cytochrome P450 [Saccharothrix espanaensis]CCH34607.1 Cytochrome P450 family protein [Saccharothrix espanaensis DSM 44229]
MSVPVAPGRLPLLGHTVSLLRRRAEFTAALRGRGEVVKVDLGPVPTYFVTSPRLTHQVLVTDGARFRKGLLFERFRPYMGNGLALSDGSFHRRQRRMMQPAFHRERIAHYAEAMVRAATDLADSWQAGEPRVVEDDMQALAVTVVGETLFSTGIGQRAIAEIRRSVFDVIQNGAVRALSPGFVSKLPIPVNRKFDLAIERMRAIVLEVIASWRAEGVDHGDLLSTMLLAHDDESGGGMSDQQVYDEVITLLTAGIETSAVALGWLFHELAEHPEVERRVHAQVDEVLAGRPVTFADLPRLGYLYQVVNEVLRKYPIWILMRKAVEPVDLAGTVLPTGAEVIVSPHVVHHDPAVYPDPERFDPDRWTGERTAAVPRGAFVPFGGGARQCIGNVFAQTEIVIALATVAARWRLVQVPGTKVRTKFTTAAYPVDLVMTPVPRT